MLSLIGAKLDKNPSSIQRVLKLPPHQRFEIFKKQGSKSFKILEKIFLSKKSDPSLKWQALMSMARLSPKKSQKYINLSLESKNWFLKNAGLIALEIVDSEKALQTAARLLHHPSLILRTASVEVIKRQKARQYKNILREKLYAKENFRNGKSLWIRYTILQTLSEFSNTKDKKFFTQLLSDSDPRIAALAEKTLRRLPSYKNPLKEEPIVAREGFEPPAHGL